MILNEDYYDNKTSLIEGVRYNKENDMFIFNFSDDDVNNIIKLRNVGYESTIYNHLYYFGYEFDSNIESSLRSRFIKSIKFPDNSISNDDKTVFIKNAIISLDSFINLMNYDILVFPQSMSELTRDLIKYLSKINRPKFVSIELIKELPYNIEFDYDMFSNEILNSKTANGKPRYTEAQKKQVLSNIESMMDNIHKSDYFSIARNIKKSKYRPYISNFYKFKNKDDEELYKQLNNGNVLIVDDIVTSGSTILLLLKTLRIINNSNNITIFSLLGKNLNL